MTGNPFKPGDRVSGTFWGEPFTGDVIEVRSDRLLWVRRDGRTHQEWFHTGSLTKIEEGGQ
ncbi:hypothetical protein [Sphingopyxis flava]|uniref:DUF5348 domain-containing protein n=1 Tax=Sphingopyxis flava TaxID=1507287 RepID=A0A1T5BR63_9SPHN|nr:hypothetical protein [Sphingopyxis flava]SKB49872.1 hypothetical protein SAMN06295937_100784 [Sphingopyxis flava]